MEVEFGDQISFLKAQNNLPEVVIVTECLTSKTSYFFDSTQVVNKAARILQEEMSTKFKEFPQPKWPETAEELRSGRFEPPANSSHLLNLCSQQRLEGHQDLRKLHV